MLPSLESTNIKPLRAFGNNSSIFADDSDFVSVTGTYVKRFINLVVI